MHGSQVMTFVTRIDDATWIRHGSVLHSEINSFGWLPLGSDALFFSARVAVSGCRCRLLLHIPIVTVGVALHPVLSYVTHYLTTLTMTDMDVYHQQESMMRLKPGEVSTGTTIMALPFDGGVVVCADTRTSTGTYVANRVSDKLVQLSDQIYACRSGSAADTQALTDYVHFYLSQLK